MAVQSIGASAVASKEREGAGQCVLLLPTLPRPLPPLAQLGKIPSALVRSQPSANIIRAFVGPEALKIGLIACMDVFCFSVTSVALIPRE